MSDPFRDDLDAAHARADVLAREKAQLEAEVARLETELAASRDKAHKWDAQTKASEKRKDKAKAKADKAREDARARKDRPEYDERRKSRRGWIFAACATVGLIAAGVIPNCLRKRDHAQWEVAHEAREVAVARWDATLDVAGCVRATENVLRAIRGLDSETTDPRGAHPRDPTVADGVTTACAAETLLRLVDDPELAAPGRAAMAAWLADRDALAAAQRHLADYYGRGDWKDDNYASAADKWRPFAAARGRLVADMQAVRDTVLPWVSAAVIRRRDTQPRDSVAWWRVEIGARIDAIAEARHAADAASVDEQLLRDLPDKPRALAAAIVADAKAAPLDIRRDVRATYLEELAGGATQIGEIDNRKFWNAARGQHAPFPPEAAEPSTEGCGGGAD